MRWLVKYDIYVSVHNIHPSESKGFQKIGVRMGHINSDLSGIRPNGITYKK